MIPKEEEKLPWPVYCRVIVFSIYTFFRNSKKLCRSNLKHHKLQNVFEDAMPAQKPVSSRHAII